MLSLHLPGTRFVSLQRPLLIRRRNCYRQRGLAAPRAAFDDSLRNLELRVALERAVQEEDYATAARLRDALQEADPVARAATQVAQVKQQLQEAQAQEQFQAAAELRDQLVELLAPPPPPEFQCPPAASEVVNDGVRVVARSYYNPAHSCPDRREYTFSTTIRITNEGQAPVQLRNGYWCIMDARRCRRELRGPHVLLCEQPILQPGQSFEYQCDCPLRTPVGCMEGYYEVWRLVDAGKKWVPESMNPLKAVIGRLGLRAEEGEQLV